MIGMNDFPLIQEYESLKKSLDSMTKFGICFACKVDRADN